MTDSTLVADAGIRSAIIVDDYYDEVPRVAELVDEDGWSGFFDDAQGENRARIEALFPSYDPDNWETLKSSQQFIEALWQARDDIRDLLGDLFDDYEQKANDNRPLLQAAEAAVEALDISFTTHGRDFITAALDADLILIDLFLGLQQGPNDRKVTVERLKTAIDDRTSELPSIILMSRVPGIDNLAKAFREDVQLHASAFRYVPKSQISKPGRVEGLILTLAAHRADSQALARFVEVWQEKAVEAVQKAAGDLRKIDIDDLQHIRSMLLRFEGINTSSYILDVFDRVLQYEIEAHSEVVEAASPLDAMADDPAPLMIANDRDTYRVVERTLFVNPKRRAQSTGAVWPITFGDILGPRPGSTIKPRGFFSGRDDLVFFVASPECDLIRKDGLRTALLVAGTLEEIDISKPLLRVSGRTTPILVVDDEKRCQVTWDFGNLRTITLKRTVGLLKADGDAVVAGRLRSVSALDLGQQLLATVGRVAQIPPLPRSFNFSAEIHFPSVDGNAQQLALPPDVQVRGNMLVHRNGQSANLIFDSSCEDELTTALLSLDINVVSNASRVLVGRLMELRRIRKLFRSGLQWIKLPLKDEREAKMLKDGEPPPEKDGKKPKLEKVGMIVTETDFENKLGNKLAAAGLLFQIEVDDADI